MSSEIAKNRGKRAFTSFATAKYNFCTSATNRKLLRVSAVKIIIQKLLNFLNFFNIK